MRLKDLAEHLGLSQTTVSRALNGYPEVKEATRLRVAEAADQLGYRPNASALRLATGRAGAIGLVLRGADELGPHMSEFLSGLGARMASQDIDILVTKASGAAGGFWEKVEAAQACGIELVVIDRPLELLPLIKGGMEVMPMLRP